MTTIENDIRVGDIVQLDPDTTANAAFRGCFMVVTAVKRWGAQGYVQALGATRDERGGQAHYRANWPEMHRTGGRAVWMPQ